MAKRIYFGVVRSMFGDLWVGKTLKPPETPNAGYTVVIKNTFKEAIDKCRSLIDEAPMSAEARESALYDLDERQKEGEKKLDWCPGEKPEKKKKKAKSK